ncbi:hypothetical protein [Streptomyces rimosus]
MTKARPVLHAGETRHLRQAASGDLVKRHAVMLRANPEALRFCIGANVRIAKSNLAEIAATKTYLGLSQLYEQLHATVYDNHMHTAVVPAVRQAVNDAVRAMRNERGETLAGQLEHDPLLQPAAAMLGGDRHAKFVAAAVAVRMASLLQDMLQHADALVRKGELPAELFDEIAAGLPRHYELTFRVVCRQAYRAYRLGSPAGDTVGDTVGGVRRHAAVAHVTARALDA